MSEIKKGSEGDKKRGETHWGSGSKHDVSSGGRFSEFNGYEVKTPCFLVISVVNFFFVPFFEMTA